MDEETTWNMKCNISCILRVYVIFLLQNVFFVFCMNREATNISSNTGHYPHEFCQMTNIVILAEDWSIRGNVVSKKQLSNLNTNCFSIKKMFGILPELGSNAVTCDATFDVGYIFTVYYYYGSNYFHLHYDMMLPIYSVLEPRRRRQQAKKMALLPSVETSRLEIIDWSSPAFSNSSSYWMQMLKVLAGSADLLPIDDSLSKKFKILCFERVFFGTPHTDFSDKVLMQSFISYVKEVYLILDSLPEEQLIGLIHRDNRRKILNEGELVQAVSGAGLAKIEIVDFAAMSYREQVESVQKYTVLVGVNGAGLTNALYLPSGAVAVQLVPFNATLNFQEFGQLLQTRGPYLEWHNKHQDLTVEHEFDLFRSSSDTTVPADEFLALMKTALSLVGTDQRRDRSEL